MGFFFFYQMGAGSTCEFHNSPRQRRQEMRRGKYTTLFFFGTWNEVFTNRSVKYLPGSWSPCLSTFWWFGCVSPPPLLPKSPIRWSVLGMVFGGYGSKRSAPASYSITTQRGRCWEKYLKSSGVAPGQLVSSNSSRSCSWTRPERPVVVNNGQPEITAEYFVC